MVKRRGGVARACRGALQRAGKRWRSARARVRGARIWRVGRAPGRALERWHAARSRRKRERADTRPAHPVHRPSPLLSRLLTAAVVLAGLAGASLAAVVLAAAVRAHPYFAVSDITVTPIRRLSTAGVLAWAGVSRGMPIWDVDEAALKRRLEEHPWIARATVRRELPRRIVVTLDERRAAAIVLLEQPYYVDARGVAFAPLRSDEPLELPFVTGIEAALIEGEAPYVRHAIRSARKILRSMKAAGLPFRVSEVHIDRQQGITVFPVEPRVALRFGWRALPDRVERLRTLLGTFAGREAQLRAIDLTSPDEAVIRLRAAPRSEMRVNGVAGAEARGVKRET